MLLIELGVGDANGAFIRDRFGTNLGEGGDANLLLLICLNCVDRVPFGDPEIKVANVILRVLICSMSITL